MTYQDIIKILQKHDHHFDGKQLNKAIKLLLKYCHNNKYSLEILETLISIYPDTKSVIISLLFFSSVKDNLKLTHIKHHFGEEIATIFFSLAELFRIHDTYSYNTIQETFQLFCSLKPNITIRVLLIRFAYLLHKIIFNCTISDIGYYLVSEEIKDIYVPLFKEITVEKINNELQNVCLEILQPHSYKFITDFLKENYQNPDQLVIKVINSFHDILSRLDLAYIISGRVKSTYSIAQKLVNKSNKIKHLCDIIGIRVIVEQDNECYQVLNTIFNNYPYAPDRNKDFIKFPKENNYQSLHAVIIYKDSRKLEVQIRTRRMHNIAQYGSASHLQYKMNLQNGNNLDITYNILNKLIFNTLNQYTIHSILPKYLRIYNRSDGLRSYIIEPIKPNKQTLKQDVLIYYENTLYRYKSQVYTEHGIDLDLDIKSSVDRLQSSPNIYVIPAISHQVLFGTNYQYNYEVIINYQEYNVEIVVRQVLQRDNTTHAVWQLPSEQIEYNLPRSNISLPKQTVPIVNIMHTSKHLMDKVSNFTKDLLQKNVRKFAQQKIHYAVDSNKLNTKLLTHPNISIAKGGMCIAHSTSIKDGDLPFLLAVHNGNLEIVEKFFTYPKLDIYQINQNKEHALIIATQLGNIEMLRLLISYLHKKFQDNIEEFERYLNLTNSEDQSALYFAFDYFGFDPCRSIEMIKILLSITNQDGYPLVQDSQTIDITAKLQRIFFQEVLNGNRQIVEKLITITKNNQLVIDINKSNITDEYSGTALLMAINMQDSDMVQLLLTHPNISIAKGGMCIAHSTSIKDGDLPFLLAVHNGNLEIVEKFFTYPKLDIYQINQNKEHALIIATQLGNIEMLRLLISYLHKKFQDNIEEFERYLNLTNSEDQSALYFAFDYFGFDPCRSIEMIKILLSITNQDGYPLVQDSQTIDITAKLQRIFFQEVLNGNRQIVKKLITIIKNNQLVIDINKSNITDEYSGTALLMAINMQDSDMVQLLLTHPNISIAKGGMCIAHSTSIKDGDLPFLLAVHNGNLEIVEKFFTYPKLDIYQINQNKEHALIIATQLGNIEMLRLLISYLHKKFQDNIEEFERYLNLTNSEDQSALYFAFDYFGFDPCRSIEMIKILLSITNQDGYPLVQDSQTIDITAKLQRIFFQEVLNGNRQIVEKLITIIKNNQLVIDINKSNITDEYSGTALLMAINMQDSDMVQLLLTHPNISIAKGGMCIAHSTSIKDGDLPFLLAVHNGNLEIVEKFFTYPKLDIYQINQNKEHALIIATQLGNIEMLRLLISYLHKKFQDNIEEFERYLNLTNSEDQSALYFAFDYFGFDPCRSIEMIKILLSITNQDGYPLVQDSQTIDITAKLQRIFFQEVLNGNRQIVEKLITITKNNQLVIDINKSNITDEYSGTALLMAINMQDSDMVQLLLTHPNIDINRSFTYQRAANINGDIYTVYPFLEALSSHNRIIDLFLKYLDKIDMVAVDKHGQVCVDSSGEIIITRNQNGESALMIAIKYGNIDILTRLIDTLKTTLTDEHFKQYLNYVEPFEGNNVLTLAGQQGHQVIAQALIGLKGKDGVPLININHQDFYGNRVQHYFTDDEDIQYEFRQYATQDFSTKTLQTIITNPQSTHYADEEAKKCISALQEQFQDQLTEQHIGQSVEAIHNYLDKLHNDRIFCLDSFGHSTISIKIKCITTTNVNSVSHNIPVEVVPKVVKYLLQKFDINLRKVLHLAWLMIKHREKTDNPQNFNFTIDLIKNLTQAAFEYTKDDVKELNVETMKQACPKGICNILISSAMPTVSLVNYDEGEKAPGYFAQNPERVREYLHATTEYTQGEIFTAAFRNKWQKMLNEFCPNYTNDDKIVWDNEPNKLNVILDQSEFLDVWSEIMEIINDLMNNENNWNPSNITQILEQQYRNVIMIHQKIEEFLQKQPQLLQTIKNSELYPIMHLVSNNQDCDIIANIVFMFVVHNADIEMAQSLIAYKNKDGTPLIQAKYAEMAEDVSDLDQGIEREHPGMLQVFLLVEYLYAQNVNQNKAEQLLRLCDDDNKCLVDTEAADVILKCLHKDDGSTHESAEDTIIHEKLGISEHTHLLGDV